MFEPSELFFAGMIVSIIGCVIKVFKLCVFNVRQVECFGITCYSSTLFDRLIGERSNSNASTYSLRGNNPMLPGPLLNA